jgi:hypothetical protein
MKFLDDAAVLAHGFRFRPAWWSPRVPESWGGFLEQLPAQERGYHRITRADLLAAATDHGLPHALLAVTPGERAVRHSSSAAELGYSGTTTLDESTSPCTQSPRSCGTATPSRPTPRCCAEGHTI